MAALSSSPCPTHSSSSRLAVPNLNLPAGFRFHPTDEELIVHYLMNQAASIPCPVPIIAEVNIYQCNPWDLPGKALFGESEWYFFSPRDRKYPNGERPNRAAGSGYWKATGTDKPIVATPTGKHVGVKKSLVFYGGRPPRGVKTDWIMHEYRLISGTADDKKSNSIKRRAGSSMRLDDWVLCRIHKKSNDFFQLSSPQGQGQGQEQEQEGSSTVEQQSSPKPEPFEHDQFQFHHQTMTMSKSCSFTDLLNSIDFSAFSQILDDGDALPAPQQNQNPPLIYHPTTTHQTLNYNNNSNMNNSHLINLSRVVDATCSDYVVANNNCNNGLNKRKRMMTAGMDGGADESFDHGINGFSKKPKVMPIGSRNSSTHSGLFQSYSSGLFLEMQ